MTPLDIALSYIRRTWNPVPVPYREKAPIGDDWQHRRIDEAAAPRFFNGAAMNVGVQLGPASGGLTDVDHDCLEALALAPYLLPQTKAIFGRRSKPRSHWLYVTGLAETIDKGALRLRDPTARTTLVELRVGGGDKGAQTVFPGSVHESGEPIEWADAGEPTSVDGDKLQRAVEALAAGCLLVRGWPAKGGRHDAALVVGGMLARAGWSVAEARQFMGAVAQAAGCENVRAKQDAAESAVRGLAEGETIYGFPALIELLGEKSALKVAEWIGFKFDDPIGRMNERARRAADEDPLPLFPPLLPAEPYPVEALGPLLSRAANAIASKVQVPEAIAAQSVLAAAALAAQAHADVMLPYGQPRPLSLYLVTVAASGERKSTADNEALWPVRKYEKALRDRRDADLQEWRIEHAAWSSEKKKIESDKKIGLDARKDALRALGPEPEQPLHPFLTAPDPTVEGLAKAWVNAPAALGVFTAEGGMFIGGAGMSDEHRLKTAATLSEAWDGRPIKRIRAGDGVSILAGRRLSVHVMVQPDAASNLLADPLLRDQGLLSRLLVAAPDSIAGTRRYQDTNPRDEAAIRIYGARILALLEADWPLAEGKRNELEPRELPLSAEAAAHWREFFDHVEDQCGPAGDLRAIGDFAAKAAEHAARIAGVLTIVDDADATEVRAEAMKGGIVLADWYVSEALRLQRGARTDPKLKIAQKLLDWLQARDEEQISFRDIIKFGPGSVRTKAEADGALTILVQHGWVTEVSSRPRLLRVVRS